MVISWLPIITTVFRSSSSPTRSSASVSWVWVIPSERAGIRRIPSALVRVVIDPAALANGVATYLSPTFPMLTRKNSSIPTLEGMSLVGWTFTVWGLGLEQP